MHVLPALLVSSMVLPPSPALAERTGAVVPRLSLGVGARLSEPSAAELVNALQAAEQKANEEPAAGLAPLREALDRYQEHGPLVARDKKAHEARVYGLLALARAHLALEQTEDAHRVMDEAIRVARGDPLPAKMFGPRLVKLYEARMSAPENRPAGQVSIKCTPACDVLINARLAGSGRHVDLMNVPLGSHRVQVHVTHDSENLFDQTIELTEDEPAFELDYQPLGVDESSDGADIEPLVDGKPAAESRRLLPRWAGILGVATGAAAVIAGGVLLGFHGRCPDGSDPTAADACINVLDTQGAGIALLAVGGATLTGFGIALAIGETRDRKRRPTGAMLGYTLRF